MAKTKTVATRHRDPYTPIEYTETVAGEIVTKQSMKDECDINNIVAKYDATGVITHLNASQATYADVSELGGYREALDRVIAVEEHFSKLPAELRAEFENDPAKYLDAVGAASEADIDDMGKGRYGKETEAETTSETAESEDSG